MKATTGRTIMMVFAILAVLLCVPIQSKAAEATPEFVTIVPQNMDKPIGIEFIPNGETIRVSDQELVIASGTMYVQRINKELENTSSAYMGIFIGKTIEGYVFMVDIESAVLWKNGDTIQSQALVLCEGVVTQKNFSFHYNEAVGHLANAADVEWITGTRELDIVHQVRDVQLYDLVNGQFVATKNTGKLSLSRTAVNTFVGKYTNGIPEEWNVIALNRQDVENGAIAYGIVSVDGSKYWAIFSLGMAEIKTVRYSTSGNNSSNTTTNQGGKPSGGGDEDDGLHDGGGDTPNPEPGNPEPGVPEDNPEPGVPEDNLQPGNPNPENPGGGLVPPME